MLTRRSMMKANNDQRRLKPRIWALAPLLTLVILVVPNSAATASGCYSASDPWQYSGKASGLTWQGVEGDISVDTETLPNDTGYHLLNYIDMNENTPPAGSCPYTPLGTCWIQIGDSVGTTGPPPANCKTQGIRAYIEKSDVNGYECFAATAMGVPLAQNDYYSLHYTGTNSGTNGLVEAWITAKNGVQVNIGYAYLPNYAKSTLYALTEFDSFSASDQGCPSLAKYQYFGHYNGPLEQSPDGLSWTPWTTSEQYGPDSPLNLNPNPDTHSDNFETWG